VKNKSKAKKKQHTTFSNRYTMPFIDNALRERVQDAWRLGKETHLLHLQATLT